MGKHNNALFTSQHSVFFLSLIHAKAVQCMKGN